MDHPSIDTLTDDQLLHRVEDLVQRGNALTADLLAHLGEVDARRLYAEAGHPSMFDWCTKVLGLSEGAAYKRIRAARAVRRFPALLEWVAAGRLHLAGVCLLAPHLTEEGQKELLEAASGKSKREVERLVADLSPSPPVADSIRRLPARKPVVGGGGERPLHPDENLSVVVGQLGRAVESLRGERLDAGSVVTRHESRSPAGGVPSSEFSDQSGQRFTGLGEEDPATCDLTGSASRAGCTGPGFLTEPARRPGGRSSTPRTSLVRSGASQNAVTGWTGRLVQEAANRLVDPRRSADRPTSASTSTSSALAAIALRSCQSAVIVTYPSPVFACVAPVVLEPSL